MSKTKQRTIDDEVNHILEALKDMKIGSEEYTKATCDLEALCRARNLKTDRSVSVEVIISALVPIAQVLLIMNHEVLHVISTKALGFVLKGRM